jgi:glycosyltransferase involved in cell wall biosynthesis
MTHALQQLVPKISVVLPVHNAERYLEVAIRSILEQTFDDFELIAVDDGSTDASLRLLHQIAARDGRVRILSRAQTGIVGALNDGIAVARADLIARMDADDIALPHRFERQFEWLAQNPGCVAVGSAVRQIDSDGDPVGVQGWPTSHQEIEDLLLHARTALIHPTAMIRSAALRSIGGYRAKYQWIEDQDLWLRLGEIGRLANLREPLLQYRLHEYSVCAQKKTEQARLWEKLLAETYARRGLTANRPQLRQHDQNAAGNQEARTRWIIRVAARSGNYRTAAKHAKRLAKKQPLHLSTWTTLFKATNAVVRRAIHKNAA